MYVKKVRIYNWLILWHVLCSILSKHSKLSQRKVTQWPFWFKSHRYPSVRYQKLSGISWCFSDCVGCCSCYICYRVIQCLISSLVGALLSAKECFQLCSWASAEHMKAMTKISDCFRMMCYSVSLSYVIQRKMLIWRYVDLVFWLLIWSHALKIQSGWVKFWVCLNTDASPLWF